MRTGLMVFLPRNISEALGTCVMQVWWGTPGLPDVVFGTRALVVVGEDAGGEAALLGL